MVSETTGPVDRLNTGLLFIVVASIACLMPAQSDTWWQLRAGEEIWRTHAFLLRDTFSHSVYGQYWPNHEWLSQAMFYAVYRVGGLPLLTALAAAFVTGAWALSWRLTAGDPMDARILLMMAIFPAATGWVVRPQVMTLFFVVLTVAMLVRERTAWLPLLFLLWANLHGGVVLGLVVMGSAVVASALAARHLLPRLLRTTALCAAATFLTPLGVRLWGETLASFGRLRELRVEEWAPPRLADPAFLFYWIIAALLIGLTLWPRVWRRRMSFAAATTLCTAWALLPLSMGSARNVPPFLVIAVPAISVLLAQVVPASRSRTAVRLRPALVPKLLAVFALVAAGGVFWAWHKPLRRLEWTPLPAGAVAALRTCPERLYNGYNDGGYVIWFVKDRKVLLDSRQDPYPPELVLAQMTAERTGEYRDLFKRYGIRCALTPAAAPLGRRLAADGWRHLYADSQWAILADGLAADPR